MSTLCEAQVKFVIKIAQCTKMDTRQTIGLIRAHRFYMKHFLMRCIFNKLQGKSNIYHHAA